MTVTSCETSWDCPPSVQVAVGVGGARHGAARAHDALVAPRERDVGLRQEPDGTRPGGIRDRSRCRATGARSRRRRPGPRRWSPRRAETPPQAGRRCSRTSPRSSGTRPRPAAFGFLGQQRTRRRARRRRRRPWSSRCGGFRRDPVHSQAFVPAYTEAVGAATGWASNRSCSYSSGRHVDVRRLAVERDGVGARSAPVRRDPD